MSLQGWNLKRKLDSTMAFASCRNNHFRTLLDNNARDELNVFITMKRTKHVIVKELEIIY